MTEKEAIQLLKIELDHLGQFENYHGITRENLEQFIVQPYQVNVDPDDLETEDRNMWVVMLLSKSILVGIDPLDKSWCVLHPLKDDKFIRTVGEETLAEALDSM